MSIPVPTTVKGALDPVWWTAIMQEAVPGCRIDRVELVQTIRVVASKLRVRLVYDPAGPKGPEALCLKAFLDCDPYMDRLSFMSSIEARFYAQVANHVPMRVARSPYAAVDPQSGLGLIVMDDLTALGARFMSAIEPYGVDRARESVGQLAALHATYAGKVDGPDFAWAGSILQRMVAQPPIADAPLQELLDGERGEPLSRDVLDAARIGRALRRMTEIDASLPQTLRHGDCHAGNVFDTAEGPGFTDWQLVQRGHWAADVAYHLPAVLTVEEAEANEEALIAQYLECYTAAGGVAPSFDEAWDDYRRSILYGYYLWITTIRVDPPIIAEFCKRIGRAMMRHDTLGRIEAY